MTSSGKAPKISKYKEPNKKIKMSEQMHGTKDSTGEPTSPNSIQSVSEFAKKLHWTIKKNLCVKRTLLTNNLTERQTLNNSASNLFLEEDYLVL